MRSAVIIGAGLGGLAAALRIRQLGYTVTVFEKQPRPGGRANVLEENGFRADTGPTILVMRDTLDETYRALGEDVTKRLDLVHLDPNYRLYFHDDTHLDLFSDMTALSAEVERFEPGATERLFQFLGINARKYELGMEFVRRNYDSVFDLLKPRAGIGLFGTGSHRSMYGQVGKYFRSDKLRKAFSFHSMFLGISPFEARAMYSMITYADMAGGMWFVKGGVYRLVEDLTTLAEEHRVEIRTNAPVKRILTNKNRAVGIELESGETAGADLVISNADLPYTYQKLLNGTKRKDYSDSRLRKMDYACSGYILFLGLDRTWPGLRHQSLYFSKDYHANLNAIFRTKTLPEDPSFHLNIPTVTDPSLAPPGHSLFYLLAPMPNLQDCVIDWENAAPVVREQLLSALERIIDPNIRQHIVWEKQYRPVDWLQDMNAAYGTAFGSLSHRFFQSSYFRPHNTSRKIDGMYFVGQGTYPGIGMPMVLLSARLVTERIAADMR